MTHGPDHGTAGRISATDPTHATPVAGPPHDGGAGGGEPVPVGGEPKQVGGGARARWWTAPGRRLALLGVVVAALAATGYALPLHRLTDAAGRLGPVAAVALGAALLLALVPRTVVSLACGAFFGSVAGSVYAVLAALLGASIAFALGRWLGRAAIARWLGRAAEGGRLASRVARAEAWLHRGGLPAVTLVRLIPLGPYGLVSYVYGTTSVRTRRYLLGTLIGATPSAVGYAGLGAALAQPGRTRPLELLPAGLGLLVSTGAATIWWLSARHRAGRPPS